MPKVGRTVRRWTFQDKITAPIGLDLNLATGEYSIAYGADALIVQGVPLSLGIDPAQYLESFVRSQMLHPVNQ